MRFSVIIPYADNCDTLRPCLDSVIAAADRLATTTPGAGVEILCINGGSRDSSDDITTECASRDQRIVPYVGWPDRRGGAGPGPARNFGIARATGDYLVFVDADDLLEGDAFVDLKAAAADIVTFLPPRGTFNLETREDRRRLFQPMIGNLLVWNAVYRRESIGGWRFPELMNCEDLVFTCGAFAQAKTLVAGAKPWYRHIQRRAGLSNGVTWQRVRDGVRSSVLMCAALNGSHVGLATRLVLAKKIFLHLLLHVVAITPRIAWHSIRRRSTPATEVTHG